MNYADTVEKVISLLKEKKVCSSSRKSHRDCYESLGSYLDQNSTEYTVKARDEWFAEIKKSLPSQRCVIWIRYVYQLEEMDSSGTVSDRRLYLNQSVYDKLPVSWKDDLDFYLEDCCKRYTKRTLELTRTYCSEGLLIFDEIGVVNISDISYEAVLILVNTKMYQSAETRNVILNYTARMIQFYEKIGKCTKPYSLLFNSQIYPHIGLIDAFSSENKAALQKTIDVIMSAADFKGKIEPFIECLQAHGYIGTTLKLAKHALTAFYLFLDIHDLGYHPDIVWIWFSEVKNTLGTSWLHWRRVLSFCNEYLLSGDIHPGGKYKYIPTIYDELPEWCKEAVAGLLEQKKREYRESGTLKSYRCSCASFCLFLIDHGYDSFKQISPEIIKEFSIQDEHSTFKGRATRFVIVRAFLRYLEEHRYTERHGLDQCLISGSAPVDKIIDVLSDEQIQRIQEYRLTHNAPVELRDIAIVLLGLKTGLRAYDILVLRFQDIDWKKCQISIIMKKTKTQITLPMPVEVGNAIYSYLKYGRPDAESDFIFVRSKAPYGRLTGKVCTRALYRILPERNDVKGGGFHVTRRTFATNLLKNHAGIDDVMDALGHRDPTSVMKYLLLDDERSRKCGLSLSDIGLMLEGGL